MFEHSDTLKNIDQKSTLRDKLVTTHESLRELFPFIVRIAIAIYDPKTKLLKTFLHSSGEDNPLDHYQALLAEAPSLQEILEKKQPRVINDLFTYEAGQHEHTHKIKAQGYGGSYTIPIYNAGEFLGFLFFNANKVNAFDEAVLRELDIYGHMISLLIISEFAAIATLTAALKTAGKLSHLRDPETGSHLDRMSRYSRIIARTLAPTHDLDDTFIEHLFMFAPLHDIGKIAIPDNILLKPGKLTPEERDVMQSHSQKGKEMIDEMLENFGLSNFEYVNVLRNIAQFHHEAINGKGYPLGIKGDDIPIEARIVAVADVFDALTSERCYKKAWSNDKAIALLEEMAGEQFDKACVKALVESMDQILEVQERFKEDFYG